MTETQDPHTVNHADGLLVDLSQIIYALSDALDLVGIDDVGHGKRVGIMATACGRELGLSGDPLTSLFGLGMLHDIGVSSTATHNHLFLEFDWEGSQHHCEIGYQLLRDFPPLAKLADPVRFHHTHWEDLISAGIDEGVALRANLTYLSDRVDILAATHYGDGNLLMQTGAIRDKIAACKDRYFAPQLVEAFLDASAAEAFWLELEPRGIHAVMQAMQRLAEPYPASINELKQLARMFAHIVDAKSAFTAEHSSGVSRLARFFAEGLGLDPEQCDKLEIAGLLHDLGKLRVPDEVLDKPGRLDDRERKIMNTHSFETFQILRRIHGFEEITRWAAYHHEERGSSGYPFRLDGDKLPLEARILRVADIFQAMTQNRPYRAGLTPEAILEFMNKLVAERRVEAEIFQVALKDMPGALAVVRASDRP